MKIFIIDGTPNAFWTAVCYALQQNKCEIISNNNIQLTLESDVQEVVFDEKKCESALKIVQKCDCYAARDVEIALKSNNIDKYNIALEYLRLLLRFKRPIRNRKNLPQVIAFDDLVHKVTDEAHKLKGFLRFIECANGILYAPYTPDNDVTDMLVAHFSRRLQSERFVIHDLNRKYAVIYNRGECISGYADNLEIYLSENELAFENLWKKYYEYVNIPSREHIKQMKGYMPVRYWKFLPEKQ